MSAFYCVRKGIVYMEYAAKDDNVQLGDFQLRAAPVAAKKNNNQIPYELKQLQIPSEIIHQVSEFVLPEQFQIQEDGRILKEPRKPKRCSKCFSKSCFCTRPAWKRN